MALFNIRALRPELCPGDRLAAKPLRQRPRTYPRYTEVTAPSAFGKGSAMTLAPCPLGVTALDINEAAQCDARRVALNRDASCLGSRRHNVPAIDGFLKVNPLTAR